MKKYLLSLILILSVFIISGVSAFDAARTISGNNVQISIDVSNTTGFILDEVLPAGVTPTNVGQGGIYTTSVNTIRWTKLDNSVTILTYGYSGSGTVSGSITGGEPSSQKSTTGDTTLGSSQSSPQIKINEFESNPSSGNEWIELYNPNNFAVNLSGWKLYDGLVSVSLLQTFPEGTNIPALGYIVYDLSSSKLNNANDFVILSDNSGIEMDRTATLADNSGDGKTWQRIPNGFDTDSNGDWQFLENTKGSENIAGIPQQNQSSSPDDLMVNYIRGKILLDGTPAPAGTQYKVEVLNGGNTGYTLTGTVDSNIPNSLEGNGYYDTLDKIGFSTGASFKVELVDDAHCSAQGIFENGGNGDFSSGDGLITINCAMNHPPVMENIGNKQVNENDSLQFYVNASDVDGDALNYTAQNLPIGATFLDRLFSWIPDFTQSGIYQVLFKVTDGEKEVQQNTTITVNDVNRAPVIAPVEKQQILEDTAGSVAIQATDPDGDHLTYTITKENTSEIDCSFENNSLKFMPKLNWNGAGSCDIKVSDGKGGTDSATVEIDVQPVNDAPVLKNINNIVANEGALVEIIASATDIDGDSLIYSINDSRFTNEENGSFIWQTNYQDSGVYSVKVIVEDGNGGQDNKVVKITINDVNQPPKISPIADITIEEDSGFIDNILLEANDVDGTINRFEVVQENVSKVDCVISNSKLGVTPAKDFAGIASCKIRVYDDKGGFNETSVNIIVNGINDAPQIVSYLPLSNPVIKGGKSQEFKIVWKDIDSTNANVLVRWYVDGVEKKIGDSYIFTAGMEEEEFEIKVVVDDNKGLEGGLQDSKTWTLNVFNRPTANGFNGATTDFLSIPPDQLGNVSNLILEKAGIGKIEFLEPIDLSRNPDFGDIVKIERGSVATNFANYPELNQSARITLTGLSYSTIPEIFYNGGFTTNANLITQACTFCNMQSYTSPPTSKGVVVFNIDHFTSFAVGESGTLYLASNFKNLDSCKSGAIGDLDISVVNPDEGDSFGPGDEIKIEADVSNNAEDDKNVIVEATLYNTNKNHKEESINSNSKRVDSGEEETFNMKLKVPDDFKDDNYILFLKAYEKGKEVSQCNQQIVGIDLAREEDKVIINNVELNPKTASSGNSIDITTTLGNIGDNDENVYITVDNSELGIHEKTEEFVLEKFGDKDTITKDINIIIPKNSAEKSYKLDITAVYDNGKDTKSEEINVVNRILTNNNPSAGELISLNNLNDGVIVLQGLTGKQTQTNGKIVVLNNVPENTNTNTYTSGKIITSILGVGTTTVAVDHQKQSDKRGLWIIDIALIIAIIIVIILIHVVVRRR